MGAIWCALITPTITGAPRRLDLAIRWQQPVVMGAIVCTIYILSLETDNFLQVNAIKLVPMGCPAPPPLHHHRLVSNSNKERNLVPVVATHPTVW